MSSGAGMGLVLLAFGLVSMTVLLVGVRRRERTGGLGRVPPPDAVRAGEFAARPDSGYDLVLRCGAWANGVNVSWPLATLLVSPDQAELRVWSAPEPIRVARGEVTGLHEVAGRWSRGLKFRTESGRLDKVTVWAGRDTVARMRELGWP
ncbi:hypothetical protein GCM10010172_73770 [Paractinoplanes ferrugineus]|uniref:DUF2550 domain-containing protein n=1 Tax=Paractinoplanes ferrugineus TaxID=113564 RepID=A0A919J069_9ACTN|nr:hypothetical protein [Actinoplanes ferrugineus]GIE11468.1 hypothetical protein Afe05nite_33080 [Actinoplanes ferrugineus]